MSDLPSIYIRVTKKGKEVARELVIDGQKAKELSKPEIIDLIQQFASSLRDY